MLGTKVVSFSELESIDIDSVDSICISDKSTRKGAIESTTYNQQIESPGNSVVVDTDSDSVSKQKVIRIVRSLKAIEKLHQRKKEIRMSLLTFMDMIRDQEYSHVSMCMLEQFIKSCRMVPKPYYLHYYVFFLYYAIYYHTIRSTSDVIDEKMKPQHMQYLLNIKRELKFLQHIIKESRTRSISSNE